MPYRRPGSPYLWINQRFGKIRVQKPTGTTSAKTAKAMESLLNRLWTTGKGQIVEQVANGTIDLPELFSMDLAGKLATTVSATTGNPFSSILDWIDANPGYTDQTKNSNKSMARQLIKKWPTGTVSDMPNLLRKYRVYCLKESKPRAFNQTRSLLQAFAAAIDGRYKPLWTEITNIDPIKYDVDVGKALTYRQVRELSRKMYSAGHPDDVFIMWSLLLTGFRKGEYLSDWEVYDKFIRVKSGKSKQTGIKTRIVPRISHAIPNMLLDGDTGYAEWRDTGLSFEITSPYDPGTTFQAFERRLRDFTNRTISNHDFRHTHKQWARLAGVDSARVETYLGHKINPNDIAKLYGSYTETTLLPLIESDAKMVTAWLAEQEAQYLADFDETSPDFGDGSAKFDDAEPVLILKRNTTKRPPRPSVKPQPT